MKARNKFGRMVVIPPIFTSDGMSKGFHLYISRAGLAADFNRRFVASLIVEFEIIIIKKIFPSS